MRCAKVLGLAAAAALVLMALAGVGVASATQICKPVESGGDGKCPNGSLKKELSKGEFFTASSTDLVLTSPTTYVSCASSSIRLKMTSENGIALIEGQMTALSFADCETSGGTRCVTSVANLPYEAVINPPDIIVSHETGIAIGLECGFLVSCELIAQEQLLGVEGNRLVATSERPAARKGQCPVWPRLDASYSAPPGFTFLS